MVGELGCHGRAPRHDLRLVLALQAPMRVTAMVEPHGAPTPPAGIPRRFGKGPRLTPLALRAQAPGPLLPLHGPRVHTWGAAARQDLLQAGFARPAPHGDPLESSPF